MAALPWIVGELEEESCLDPEADQARSELPPLVIRQVVLERADHRQQPIERGQSAEAGVLDRGQLRWREPGIDERCAVLMELAPMILGPPIVLPALVAVEHALEPFEGAVPADLGPL